MCYRFTYLSGVRKIHWTVLFMYYKARHLFVVYIQGLTWDYYILSNTFFSVEASNNILFVTLVKVNHHLIITYISFYIHIGYNPGKLIFRRVLLIGGHWYIRDREIQSFDTNVNFKRYFKCLYSDFTLFFLSSLSQAWWLSIVTHYHSLDLIKVVSICICCSYV